MLNDFAGLGTERLRARVTHFNANDTNAVTNTTTQLVSVVRTNAQQRFQESNFRRSFHHE